MKVNYAKRVIDQIREAKVEAVRQGREIESIELNDDEWTRLQREVASSASFPYEKRNREPYFEVHGIPIYKNNPFSISIRGYGLGEF